MSPASTLSVDESISLVGIRYEHLVDILLVLVDLWEMKTLFHGVLDDDDGGKKRFDQRLDLLSSSMEELSRASFGSERFSTRLFYAQVALGRVGEAAAAWRSVVEETPERNEGEDEMK